MTEEELQSMKNLFSEIEEKNNLLDEMEIKCNWLSAALNKAIQEKDQQHRTYVEEMRKMQSAQDQSLRLCQSQMIRKMESEQDQSKRIWEENGLLKCDLEYHKSQMRKMEAAQEQAQRLFEENRLRKCDLEFHQSEMRKVKSAQDQTQRLYEENRLLKCDLEYQRKELQQWAEDLERQENKIVLKGHQVIFAQETLKRNFSTMDQESSCLKDVKGESDIQKKTDEMLKELKENKETKEYYETLINNLTVKERVSNDELRDIRVALTNGADIFLGSGRGRPTFAIKRLGEIDAKPFRNACTSLPAGERDLKSAKLCSFWQDQIKDPHWHPFKMITVYEDHYEIIDENDEKLKELKQDFGQEVYDAVTRALLEINEHNASGRYPISELWNLKEDKKASSKEVINHILNQLKTSKRRKL